MADGYISQIKLPNEETYDFRDRNLKVYTGSCSTAAGTAIKDVVTDGIFTLEKGAVLFVNFINTNSAAVGNLKLKINGEADTNAKPIKYLVNGNDPANIPEAGYLRANQTYMFRYDGTNWVADLNYYTYSNDFANKIGHYNNILARKAIAAESLIVGDETGYEKVASGVTFNLAYPIVWCTGAVNANASNYANMFLQHYDRNIATGAKSGFTSTANKAIYLIVTINGNIATIDSNIITDTLPSSDDGKVYISLGKLGAQSTGANYFFLYPVHPMFWYKNGAIREYGGGSGIKDITRSGTTFTATRDDGSTFTFTQQDNAGITSVTIGATSPVQSSTSTAQTGSSASTTISLKDAYGDTKNPYGSKTKNYVLAAPSNANGVPSFRALVAADIPNLSWNKITSDKPEYTTRWPTWNEVTGKPDTFTPDAHEHNYIGKDGFIAYPSDGRFSTRNSHTGYIKIKIPYTKSATMFTFDVDIYNYSGDTSVRYHIGGYNYDNASWINTTAYCIAPLSNTKGNLTVRFWSNSDDEMYVSIGEPDTSWSIPSIIIHNITLNFNNDTLEKWKSGWTITIENTAFDNSLIKRTVTNTNVAYKTAAAKLTTTANAIAYYTDTTGTFGSKASANGALYATSANGALQWGTLPIAQGGTGKTNAADAWTALGGGASGKHADSYFALASHNHNASDINAGILSVERIPVTLTRAQLISTEQMAFTNWLPKYGNGTAIPAKTMALFADGLAIKSPATANDAAWLRFIGTGEADSVLEIATSDDANNTNAEKIVARQYNGSSAIYEAILLGKIGSVYGATSFPVQVSAPKFIGNLTGTADKATADADNNTISTTYLKKSGGQMTGPLTWKDNTALPQASSLSYVLGIDAFASGGTTKWIGIDGLRTSLGLSNALHFIGQATTTLADGDTGTPTISGQTYSTKTAGDVVLGKDDGREYVWTGSAWEILGQDASTTYDSGAAATNTWVSRIQQASDRTITVTTAALDTSGTWSGNAATATGISKTGGSTANFWRGDNTWSSTLTGSITISKAGECGLEVINSQATNPHKGFFGGGGSGNFGIYDRTYNKWIVYNDPNGNAVLNGNANTATKATQDESGNNIKATYAASFSISDHTITLKNKNGVSLGTVTVPDNNTATAADNILDGSNSGTQITYAPYTTQQSKLSFDTSSTNPTRTDRLNLNGYLYATKLYSGGNEVLTSHQSLDGYKTRQVKSKSLTTAGWYRILDCTAYSMTFFITFYGGYNNQPPTPVTFLISHAYSTTKIEQIGRSANIGWIQQLRAVHYDTSKFYIDVYYAGNKGNTCAFEITPLDPNARSNITLIDFTIITDSITANASCETTLESHADIADNATSANYMKLYEVRGTTTTLNKAANYVAAGAMFHLIASSSTSATDNGKTPTDANILQMNWDNSGGYDAQLGIATGANRMYFRSRPSQKVVWDEVAHAPVGTAGVGNATQPVYMTSEGVITAGTALKALAYKDSLTSSDIPDNAANTTGNAATATAIQTAGTTAQFYRGDNSWSNILKQTAASALGIDTNRKIGTAIKDLHFTVGSGSGTGINDGNAGGITIGTDTASYGGIYWQSSGSYGLRLHFATTGSFANGAYTRMLITHDGKVGIGTLTPDTLLTVNGNAKADKFIGALQGNADTATNATNHIARTDNPHNVTAAQLGLGNVENTKLSTWTGSTNITTLGTITTGTWNGTAIANNKLVNSSLTVGNKSINLGASGTVDEIITYSTTIGQNTSWDITNSGAYPAYYSSGFSGDQNPSTNQNAPYSYGTLYVMRANTAGAAQFYISHHASSSKNAANGIRYRSGWDVTNTEKTVAQRWEAWATILDDKNYNLYSPKLDGTGATGSWGINITGNAANVTGTVAIGHGGTGATSAADARTNLGLGSMATETATKYMKWQTTSSASTALYDFGAYCAQGTATGTGPNGSNYYNIINIPYRKASGNIKADWGWQLGNTTSNDSRMYYRTSGDNVWGDWQTIAHATTSTNNIGSATQPVYMTAAGVITAGTALKDLAYIAKPSSNTTTTYLRGDGSWVGLADMGLSNVLHFIGVTTTDMTGGTATNHSWTGTPAGISNYTPKQGDVVINSTKQDEWVCTSVSGTTYTWERLGSDTSYKIVQSAVSDPTAASTTSTTFIDTISQNANGEISATKKTLPTASTSVAGIIKIGPNATDAMAGDTNVTNVSFTAATDNNDYPVLMKDSTGSTTTAAGVKFASGDNQQVTINPSTGTVSTRRLVINNSSSNGTVPDLVFSRTSWSYINIPDNDAAVLAIGRGTGDNASQKLIIQGDGTVRPGSDNTQVLGKSTRRWKEVHGVNFYGTFNGTATYSQGLAKWAIPNSNLNDFVSNGALRYSWEGGNNGIDSKPTGVNAFGVIAMKTATNWTGQLLMSTDSEPGLYWRTNLTTETPTYGSWTPLASGNGGVYYGTCATAADVAEKVVVCKHYHTLKAGDIIVVTFTNSNTQAQPKLNVNNTGAVSVKMAYSGGIVDLGSTSQLRFTCTFIYDGTYWLIINQQNAIQLATSDGNLNWRSVLLSDSNSINENFTPTANTLGRTYAAHNVKYQPSTGTLRAPIMKTPKVQIEYDHVNKAHIEWNDTDSSIDFIFD